MKMKYMPMAEYCKEYMRYLGVAKTARRSYAESVRLLEARGFKDISTFKTLKPGDKVYRGYLDRTVMAAVIGKKPVAEVGLKVVGGHTDAPRLDLKPKPLYEKGPYVYFDCHIYGGIKKYQWLVRPLALYGTIVRKDGSKVNVAVGDDPKDPVFMISDILPHLGYDQAKKTRDEFFPAEDLDVIAWTTFAKPEKDAKKDAEPKADKNALVEFLKKTYKVDEEDLLSAELEIVPAGMPREVGFDRALIAGYGHDDRVCSFAGLQALLDASDEVPDQTASILMCDKEEIGSVGATGMNSRFFENVVAEFADLAGAKGDLALRRVLANSRMLSSDVSAGFDPNFAGAFEKKNAAFLGRGVCFNKYTGSRGKSGSNDANAEYLADVRRVMDEGGVFFQTAELGKVNQGGGGTIAYICALYGMNVVDSGVAVLSMHAPWEIISKADLYEAYKGYKAFVLNA